MAIDLPCHVLGLHIHYDFGNVKDFIYLLYHTIICERIFSLLYPSSDAIITYLYILLIGLAEIPVQIDMGNQRRNVLQIMGNQRRNDLCSDNGK